ncbi:hypothetical protein KSP39_PZI014252 [Platanthera zijinensis]|uniref:Agenet domain-containing protein n=1 Tax=Platanthera zijinensis TaxID=2320716 RepID=A0AAP0G2N9_9ASPA
MEPVANGSLAMDFKSGDAVEVSSNDEGFHGAWYEAKVVRSMPRLSRYTVVYDSIVEEGDASKYLRETVDAAHVRPRAASARGGIFSIQQHVDVFYNDGWWEGIVAGSSGSKRRATYIVNFPATGDVMEFPPSDIRVHFDWIDGKWVTPTTQVLFGVGTSVEVTSDDDGFRGAWFPATVVNSIGKKFLVEYKNLMTDDETELLRETVDSLHIRPAPPASPVLSKFHKLQEVDAYYNDGWWVGVISKVAEDSRYIVYFRPWQQELEFRHEDLRSHYDWISKRWIRASQVFLFYYSHFVNEGCA